MRRNPLIVPIVVLFVLAFIAPQIASVRQLGLLNGPEAEVLGDSVESTEFTLSDSPQSQLEIVQKRIPLTETRIELTKEYTKMHYGFEAVYMDSPKVVVVHWTAGGSIESVYNYFAKDTISVNDEFHQNNGRVNVGSQFLVDRDGSIYQLFDETFIARHCIGMNFHAIGIENIGGVDGKEDLTEEQLQANILLIKYLEAKYPTINLVIGHLESAGFVDYSEYYTELIDGYITLKADPGKEFIRKVRQGVAKN